MRKVARVAAILAASLSLACMETAANAWTLRTFYDASGNRLGEHHVCTDTQHIIWQDNISGAAYFIDEDMGSAPGLGGVNYGC